MKRRFWKMIVLACVAACACLLAAGCSGGTASSDSASGDAAPSSAGAASLEGKTLKIYCGAGMTKPFTDITNAFENETGCKVEVTYANAAQIQTQIKQTQEGDFFIAGSAQELEPVKDYVASSTDLVKHIPVLVVPTGNPAGVGSISDLANCSTVLVGDPESTPIGKIAKKAMTEAGIWDSMMADGKLTTTTTAPQISTALSKGEGQAGIVWKENAGDSVEVIDVPEMQKATKTIPAAALTCSSNEDAASAFSDFLQTGTARDIWIGYGYELV